MLVDRVINLLEEGIDVGIRIGELPDSGLHAIAVGHVRRVAGASPAYLKAHGTPRSPAELAGHSIIAGSALAPTAEWKFTQGKKTAGVRLSPRLTITNNDAAIVAALQGFGITRLMSYQIAPLLASGQLKEALAEHEDVRLPIHVLHGEGSRVSGKVRAFVDLMVSRLREDKALR